MFTLPNDSPSGPIKRTSLNLILSFTSSCALPLALNCLVLPSFIISFLHEDKKTDFSAKKSVQIHYKCNHYAYKAFDLPNKFDQVRLDLFPIDAFPMFEYIASSN